MRNQIEPSTPKSYLDSKSPAEKYVTFKFSYNHSDSFARDLLESAIQKLTQNFKIPFNTAFVYAYQYLYRGIVTVDFIEYFLNPNHENRSLLFSNAVNFLNSSFQSQNQLIEKAMQDAFNKNIGDTKDLKSSISATLLSGKKLILITESQGNFFGKQAILDFQNGENLSFGNKTGRIGDYLGTFGQLQIAPPTGSLLQKNKVVLNDRDIINLVFFEKPDSNFTLIPPSPDLRSQEIDRFANHYITSTYLNDEKMITGNLIQLREFTLQSVIDLASSLDSNCPKAVISYTKNNLQVNFDSIENTDLTGLTYSWSFGDGQTSEEKAPSHTYSEAGEYYVILQVASDYGEMDTKTIQVIVTDNALENNYNYKVCADGYVNSTLTLDIYNIPSFSLKNIIDSNNHNTCECKRLNLPLDKLINVQVNVNSSVLVTSASHEIMLNKNYLPVNYFYHVGIEGTRTEIGNEGQISYVDVYQLYSRGIPFSSCDTFIYK